MIALVVNQPFDSTQPPVEDSFVEKYDPKLSEDDPIVNHYTQHRQLIFQLAPGETLLDILKRIES